MSIDRVRHGRQIRLAEIGEAGQERLRAADVVLSAAGDAREIEAAYVARAGMHVIDDEQLAAKEKAKAQADGAAAEQAKALVSLGIVDVKARDVADGALRALIAMRKALGVGEPG